jgi:hypothetical protein
MINCVICDKEVRGNGYAAVIAGTSLKPVCGECCDLATTNVKKLVADHRDFFARTLAQKPDSLSGTYDRHSMRQNNLRTRYSDAYGMGRTLVTVGSVVKVVGIVFALIIIGGGLLLSPQAPSNNGVGVAMFALLIGAFVGVTLYVLGTFVAAQGQLLWATLDTAVNTSPLIDEDTKLAIMALNFAE